jgi:sentrin-specific protease 1
LNIISDYLKEEFENKKNKIFDVNGWQLMDADDCPTQIDGCDCGVFTCINADYLAGIYFLEPVENKF